MSMIELHQQALDSSCPAYHSFLLRYKPTSRTVYGFVEGKEDPAFYRGFIEHSLPQDWEVELIPAGCKGNVLNLHKGFDWQRYNRHRICFYVDRDLSDFLQEHQDASDNLFVTEGYSVETSILTPSTAKRVLTEALNLQLIPEEEEAIENMFNASLSSFTKIMLPIMASIIDWKRQNLRVSLDNIRPQDIFVFQHGMLRTKESMQDEDARIGYAAQVVNQSLPSAQTRREIVIELEGLECPRNVIRGKYLRWMFVEFCSHIHQTLSQLFPRIQSIPKASVSLGHKNAMAVIGPRARCPDLLRSFIASTYGAFIERTSRT